MYLVGFTFIFISYQREQIDVPRLCDVGNDQSHSVCYSVVNSLLSGVNCLWKSVVGRLEI